MGKVIEWLYLSEPDSERLCSYSAKYAYKIMVYFLFVEKLKARVTATGS